MYLDDGFECEASKQKTLDMALDIKQDLILSGFVPKVEKCFWLPVQSLQLLGSVIESRECHLKIPEIRIKKSLETLVEINSELRAKGKVFVKRSG